MNDAFAPAIAALQTDIEEMEKKSREMKSAVNTLCSHAGMDAMYEINDESATSLASIRADTFYGKTIGVASREYLEMRKASNLGPTTPKEVYNALVDGGMQFDTANEANAQISVSNTLRKNSKMFHRLPNGQYGLLAWYPNAKTQKATQEEASEDIKPDTETAADETPTAVSHSSDAQINDQEESASEPIAQGREADVPGGGP